MKPKRTLSFLLAMVMVLSLLPVNLVSVSAAEESGTATTPKNITLGASALVGGQKSNVYFGTYQQSSLGNTEPTTGTEGVDWIKSDTATKKSQGAYYSKDPIKWRVLSNNGAQAFLLSDKNLDVVLYHEDYEDVTWETSTMRSWLNGYKAKYNTGGKSGIDYSTGNAAFIGSAFSESEQKHIVNTSVVNDDNPRYNTDGGNNTTDKIFLLSIAEAKNTSYGFADNTNSTYTRKSVNTAYVYGGGHIGTDRMDDVGEAGCWWLRSPGNFSSSAAYVGDNGYLYVHGDKVTNNFDAVRPAFNLNLSSVLFTSAAKGGKSSTAAGGGTAILKNADYSSISGNDGYKLTLKDENRKFAVSDKAGKTVHKGHGVKISYSGAEKGENEYISAMITNESNEVIYYGQIAQLTEASGTADFVVPSDIEYGTYTLKLFNEQINGNYKTDYASAFVDIALTVEEHKFTNGVCTCGELEPATFDGDIYKIGNVGQLLWFAKQVNSGNKINGALTADIDISAVTDFPMIGTEENKFTGTFNGNNHKITLNLKNTEQYTALFRYIDSATIQNLTVDGTVTVSEKYGAGIVGSSIGATKIENCISAVKIVSSIKGENGKAGDGTHGGLIAVVDGGTVAINNCAFIGSIGGSTTNACGGLVGWANGKTDITNSYVAATFTVDSEHGNTFVRHQDSTTVTIENCYYLTALGNVPSGATQKSEAQFKSGEVAFLLGDAFGQAIGTDNYPVLGGAKVYYNTDKCPQGYSNDESTAEHSYENGICLVCGCYESAKQNGDCYEISNAGQLLWFAEQVNSGNSTISGKLTADIDLESREWTPIGYYKTDKDYLAYSGTFNGQNFAVTGLKVNASRSGSGLFGYSTGTVQNIKVSGDIIVSENELACIGVVGSASGTVSGITSHINITVAEGINKSSYIGGVVGRLFGNVSKCLWDGNIDIGTTYVDQTGGIVGYTDWRGITSITDCVSYGTITSSYTNSLSIGGIMGYTKNENFTMKNCLFAGEINCTAMGENTGSVTAVCVLNDKVQNRKVSNVYYLKDSAPNVAAGANKETVIAGSTAVTTEQLKNGEVAYELGETFGQTIGTDKLPVLNGKKVYKYNESNVTYLNENIDTTVFSIVSHGTKDGKTTATVCVPKEGTYTLIFAAYDGETFKACEITTVTKDSTDCVLTVPSKDSITLKKGDKIFLWKDLESLTPMCEEYTIQ